MGYRGTQHQLEARLQELQSELAVAHEQLAEASRKVEVLREQQAGRLGVWWFRLTLQRALRDDLDAARTLRHRSTPALRLAVVQHEKALQQARDVRRWVEQSLTSDEPNPTGEDPAGQSKRIVEAQPPPPTSGWRRRVRSLGVTAAEGFAVVGAGARRLWVVIRPFAMVAAGLLFVVLLIASIASGGDGVDRSRWGLASDSSPRTVEDRMRDDALGGCLVVIFTLVLIGAGLAVWLWFEWVERVRG
jgi:hypothetical protein